MASTKQGDPGVASEKDNAKLEHTAGGVTTRDDALDLGVPMLQGGPNEPAGPEDALGEGPKRGDYSDRIGPDNYHPHEVLPTSAEDRADPTKASAVAVPQRPRVAERGDTEGKKGGVDTAGDGDNSAA
jgi:hypothetical protein